MEVELSSWYQDKEDYVAYSSVGKDGKVHEHKDADCYASIVAHPGAWEVTCRPYRNRNSAPPLTFQRFFRELIKCGLVPKGVEATTRSGKNIIVVPQRGWSYHPVFVTLSLYRHADQHGKSVLGRTMRLYDQHHEAGTHFLQCLHWALAHTNYGTFHSCFSLTNSPYGFGLVMNNNLTYSKGIPAYAQLT